MIAGHLTGWPLCALCRAPVYRITRIESVDHWSHEYIAECHGETERVTLTHVTIEDSYSISIGSAFQVDPRRALPGPRGR